MTLTSGRARLAHAATANVSAAASDQSRRLGPPLNARAVTRSTANFSCAQRWLSVPSTKIRSQIACI